MLKKIKFVLGVLSALTFGLCGTVGYYSVKIPDSFYVESGEKLNIASYPVISVSDVRESVYTGATYPETQRLSLSLFGLIPVKNVDVCRTEAPVLTACGTPFGIKLLMNGVMVVRLSGDDCPASKGGIQTGDIIHLVNGKAVYSNSDIQNIIGMSGGKETVVSLNRNGKDMDVSIIPEWNSDKMTYICGMWVRDSTAGIGTMTFIDKESGSFGALGHPICDSDTGEIIPVLSGKAVPVEITGSVKGRAGIPGELNGCFTSGDCIGGLEINNKCGIFGTLNPESVSEIGGEDFKMAFRQEVEKGKAYIICTVDGCTPEKFDIEIESVSYNDTESNKNMVIRITDKRLIELTGGIVQGMSGSPIIQNDKIVGAVTHVFISDSEMGYGVFAENMAEFLSR